MLQEKNKNKALSEEFIRPINVHSWRHLENCDPNRFEMIRKINKLQKRVILSSDEVLQKDQIIKECTPRKKTRQKATLQRLP